MKFSFHSKKKRLIAGYLNLAFIVLVSFFLTATTKSASARKAYSRGLPLYFVPLWNRLAPEVTQRAKKLNVVYHVTEQTQIAVEIPEAV